MPLDPVCFLIIRLFPFMRFVCSISNFYLLKLTHFPLTTFFIFISLALYLLIIDLFLVQPYSPDF